MVKRSGLVSIEHLAPLLKLAFRLKGREGGIADF